MSTPRDPAADATRRALNLRETDRLNGPLPSFTYAGAREMAAPIRKLIEQARGWRPYDTHDIGEAVLYDTVVEFLDELSALVYTSEELGE